MHHRSESLAATRKLAKEALVLVARAPRRGAVVLVCSGDLGAGKTAFVQGLARALGLKGKIQSPTFVLEKIYALPARAHREFGFARLVHIDAYRLEHPRELAALGFKELAADASNLIVIEWGEKVRKLLPRGYRELKFTFLNRTTREIALVR